MFSLHAAVGLTRRDALTDLELSAENLAIKEPPEDGESVLAPSVAFRLAGEAGASPLEVAEIAADTTDTRELWYVSRIEAQGPVPI